VAEVKEGSQIKRGDSSAFVRELMADGQPLDKFSGGKAVVLTINKQPGADTQKVTNEILKSIEELRPTLPKGIRIEQAYSQKLFIDRAFQNVKEALRDGIVLVAVILFLFLANIRTTLITLTAIPLSLFATAISFALFDLSINTMTLGGIAVAMGELVDDAIVDVENIYRRLRENQQSEQPIHPLVVVFRASAEVRRSIVYSTIVVILVFMPLFALQGVEGKLFTPLGIAYVVSILCSLIVSLTVTPILSYWLLGNQRSKGHSKDGIILRGLKWVGERVIRFSLQYPRANLTVTLCLVAIAGGYFWRLERDFLPPFNEGTVQLNVILSPGISLQKSSELCMMVEKSLMEISDVHRIVRRTGRAELDEHAEGVNMSEVLIEMDPKSTRSREDQLQDIRLAMENIPGIITSVEQPIAHLISHMLSGVKAQIGIKLFGDDLGLLRQKADAIQHAMESVPGVTDLFVEPQVLIPQLRIEVNRERLAESGLSVKELNDYVETAMNGVTVSEILQGMQTFDLIVRLKQEFREDIDELKRLTVTLPSGGVVPLSSLVQIYEADGPNTINRENVRRRIVIQCNVEDRGIVDVVQDIQRAVEPTVQSLPTGYFVTFDGQFRSQQMASRTIAVLFVAALIGVFLVLHALFRTTNLALQVMTALPMAFIGAVAALVLTKQTVTIASMVGFVSLAGIASRNGVLLLQHYLHLVKYEGESFTKEMIVRAGLERLAPVLMTALTAGIALVPLAIAAGEPGKEILYPVATVILGGIISSTLLDFFVHPALFWLFGIRAAEQAINQSEGVSLANEI
jgi:CzcA family heavy metal efflux pump